MKKEEVLNLHDNKNAFILKNLFNSDYNWEDLFKFLEYASSKNYISSNVREEPIAFYGNELYLRVADIINPNTKKSVNNLFNGLNEVINFFDNVFEEKVNYGECYVNFHSNASIKPAHNDKWTAVVLSCIGNIEWRIFDKENYTSYITEPGDVIVIPQGVMHSVVPLEPRLSISLAYKTVDF